jgi:hypothetical protein
MNAHSGSPTPLSSSHSSNECLCQFSARSAQPFGRLYWTGQNRTGQNVTETILEKYNIDISPLMRLLRYVWLISCPEKLQHTTGDIYNVTREFYHSIWYMYNVQWDIYYAQICFYHVLFQYLLLAGAYKFGGRRIVCRWEHISSKQTNHDKDVLMIQGADWSRLRVLVIYRCPIATRLHRWSNSINRTTLLLRIVSY